MQIVCVDRFLFANFGVKQTIVAWQFGWSRRHPIVSIKATKQSQCDIWMFHLYFLFRFVRFIMFFFQQLVLIYIILLIYLCAVLLTYFEFLCTKEIVKVFHCFITSFCPILCRDRRDAN